MSDLCLCASYLFLFSIFLWRDPRASIFYGAVSMTAVDVDIVD